MNFKVPTISNAQIYTNQNNSLTRADKKDRLIVGIRNPWTPWRLYAKQFIHSYRPKEWLFKIRTLKFIENWSYHWSLWFLCKLNLTNKINETKGTTFYKYRLCHFWLLPWLWKNYLYKSLNFHGILMEIERNATTL